MRHRIEIMEELLRPARRAFDAGKLPRGDAEALEAARKILASMASEVIGCAMIEFVEDFPNLKTTRQGEPVSFDVLTIEERAARDPETVFRAALAVLECVQEHGVGPVLEAMCYEIAFDRFGLAWI